MTDLPDTSPNLGLPFYQTKLNEFEVQHNEALLVLDALVMLAVKDRDLSAPPSSPALGDRYLVKATGTGGFAGKDNRIAQYDTGGWNFYAPQSGWTCYVQDEQLLIAWDGTAWQPALGVLGLTAIQNLSLLGVGTTADTTNPLSAKLNNVLWTAKTVAEGGDGTLHYKLSKENASKTLSFLLQDNFSGRAEIGLTGDDDLHFKVSADGTTWTDALTLDRTTGGAKLNSAVSLTGDITPSQITADQNDYNPAGLSGASVLRLSSDASRNLTGLTGGADGRIAAIINAGSNNIVLKDANSSSRAANRFAFGADVTLAGNQSAALWYDATDTRWKLIARPQTAATAADLEITLAELAMGQADAMNVAQFLGSAGNRFSDSFDALTFVDTGGATNLDTSTAGLLKPANGGAVGAALFHFDGANGATSTSDSGAGANAPHSFTFSGSAAISTAQSMFGGSSFLPNGSGNYGKITSAADIVFGTGDFAISFRMRHTATRNECAIISNRGVGNNNEWCIKFGSTNNCLAVHTGAYGMFTDATNPLAQDTWVHVEWSRVSGTSRCFVNGTSIGSWADSNNYSYTGDIYVGHEAVGYAADLGADYIDEVQIVKGSGHSSNFTPPAYAFGTNNMTVRSTSFTAAAAPSTMKIVAMVNHVDAAMAGTDYKCKVSRDGGSHLSGTLTLHDRFTVPGGSVHVIESDPIDVTGITSGTAPLWQFETANNKMIELQGIYLYWA